MAVLKPAPPSVSAEIPVVMMKNRMERIIMNMVQMVSLSLALPQKEHS
jgi:hypothetical protein